VIGSHPLGEITLAHLEDGEVSGKLALPVRCYASELLRAPGRARVDKADSPPS
jgi:hypothetical protein